MDWIDGLQRAIDYLEKNLCEEISLDEAARVAYLSVGGFSAPSVSCAG